MNIQILNDFSVIKFGITGHVGVGHIHSHSGFTQDDSAGFAVISYILKHLTNIDTTIKDIKADIHTGKIQVTTKSLGYGETYARRGITPYEAKLMESAVGKNGIYTQNIAFQTFGRIYGQGALETPVAFQGAIALAILDSFYKNLPHSYITHEKLYNKYDVSLTTAAVINNIPVALMLVINGTNGGIGPDEDYEGNTNWEEKGKIMEEVKLNQVPTVVVESKAYIPAVAKELNENKFLIRAEKDIDNIYLANALKKSADIQNIPAKIAYDMMPLSNNALKNATSELADKIIHLAENLKTVDLSIDKVKIIAELAKIISEDAGGVSFMSNSVHNKVRGAGILPKISTVLSMIVTDEYKEYYKIPMIEEKEIINYINIITNAFEIMEK